MKKGTRRSARKLRGTAWRMYPKSSSRHPLEHIFVAAATPFLIVSPLSQPTPAKLEIVSTSDTRRSLAPNPTQGC